MLEFIFFHHNISKLFTDFLTGLCIEYQVEGDEDTITVSISDDVNDERVEQIEDEYDRLLDLSRDQTDSEEGESRDNYQKASLMITLNNGERSYAHVDVDVINRVLCTISTDELNRLIEAIADAVENPDDRSYCQIIKDDEIDIQ
jgi:uncharacterized membrane-anchored protein YitT (DUF2179 family)